MEKLKASLQTKSITKRASFWHIFLWNGYMKQMELPEEMKENIDYSDMNLPVSVRVLRPLVFKDGDSFCVVLGPDLQEGVFGCGKTANEALNDWNIHLKERMEQGDENDELANYIKKIL
jgi:hypothetical protein